mgnify:CR=1 FL=1
MGVAAVSCKDVGFEAVNHGFGKQWRHELTFIHVVRCSNPVEGKTILGAYEVVDEVAAHFVVAVVGCIFVLEFSFYRGGVCCDLLCHVDAL